MKGIERMMEKIIRERVFTNYMQFGFMPGQGTTDAIFILRQLQEKQLAKNRTFHLLLLTLKRHSVEYQEKLFGRLCKNLALQNGLCSLYGLCTTTPKVRVNNTYSDGYGVKVGVHQGSVLSLLLFIIVLEALSLEFCTGAPWELLYADNLVIIAETEDGLKMKLIKWKTNLEAKGLRVNMRKTKIVVSRS